MRHVVCDGCGRSEASDLPDKQAQIRQVEILMQADKRNYPENKEKHQADLCPQCRDFILQKFFRSQVEGEWVIKDSFDHELPEFMNEPTEMERKLELAE
jgi:hypothetical protein